MLLTRLPDSNFKIPEIAATHPAEDSHPADNKIFALNFKFC
jgi:hypothetical protein